MKNIENGKIHDDEILSSVRSSNVVLSILKSQLPILTQ